MSDLSGRTTVVVGASRGLGRGIACAFAEAGAPVVAVARTGPALAELATTSENIGTEPVAKTESCQSNHIGCCTAGTIDVETDDGKRSMIKRGDSYAIPAGHNAWVVGHEAFEAVEFLSAATYTKPS